MRRRKKLAEGSKENMPDKKAEAKDAVLRAEALVKVATDAARKAKSAEVKMALPKNYKSMPNSQKKVERKYQALLIQERKRTAEVVKVANAALKVARMQTSLFKTAYKSQSRSAGWAASVTSGKGNKKA